MIALVDTPIDAGALLSQGSDPGAAGGGVVAFIGAVRAETKGERVLRLEYEAYREMALAELEALAAATRARFDILALDIVHRVGVLQPGDVAVVIVARAAHRGAAFDACRHAIDTLKQTVPIWKKEVFANGAVWVGDRP